MTDFTCYYIYKFRSVQFNSGNIFPAIIRGYATILFSLMRSFLGLVRVRLSAAAVLLFTCQSLFKVVNQCILVYILWCQKINIPSRLSSLFHHEYPCLETFVLFVHMIMSNVRPEEAKAS